MKKKNVNSKAFAFLVTIGFLLAVLITVLFISTREKDKKTSALQQVATPEALDPAYYVNGSKVMAEDLSYAENEEILENL